MVVGGIGAMSSGASVIFPSENFDPRKTLECIEDYQATYVYAVPTMYAAMIADTI
jgi:fatty-acyl-CoA synthase